MKALLQYLPFIIPVIILQLILMITALVNMYRNKKTKNLNLLIWTLIVIFINVVGPVLYFLIGREDE